MSGPIDPHIPPVGCAAWGEDLKAYLDDELPAARRRAIEGHLATCPACQEELRIMQEIQTELRAGESAQTAILDPALKARILESAEFPAEPAPAPRAPAKWEIPPTPQKKNRHYWMEFGLVASLVLLMGVGTLTLMGGRIKNTFNTAAGSINTATDDDDGSANIQFPNTWSSSSSSTGEAPAAKVAPVQPDETWRTANRDSISRKVHRQASLTVGVKDVERASESVEARVREANGYVVSNALNTGEGDLKTASLEIKIPVSRFEAVLRQVSALGNVRQKDVSGQDITEQYVSANARKNVASNELATRLARLRALERRARRSNAEERWILSGEIQRLKVETAEAKARLNLLQKSSDMSDISINLQQEKPEVTPTGFMEDVSKSGKDAWASFTQVARIPVTALIWIIAYSPFWIPALLVWRKYGGFGEKRSTS